MMLNNSISESQIFSFQYCEQDIDKVKDFFFFFFFVGSAILLLRLVSLIKVITLCSNLFFSISESFVSKLI